MSVPPTPKPRFKRRYTLVLLAGVGLLAAYGLNLHWKGLLPRGEGFVLWKRFFQAALHPAISYESANAVEGTPPFLWVVLKSQGFLFRFLDFNIDICLAQQGDKLAIFRGHRHERTAIRGGSQDLIILDDHAIDGTILDICPELAVGHQDALLPLHPPTEQVDKYNRG